AEPLARRRVCEVGEGARAGPDGRVKLRAVGVLHEVAAGLPLLVGVVVRVNLDAGVDDDDDAEAGGFQVCDHLRGVWEARLVPGEDAVAVHVVNVEVDDVGRHARIPETLCDLAYARLRRLSPA